MRMEMNGWEDLMKRLEKLSDKAKVDDAAKKAVDAAKEIVASSMRSAISSVEHGKYSTGASPIAASVTATVAKVNSYGVFSVAKPEGTHPSGIRNGELAAYLNYGTSKLDARPWRARACAAAEAPAMKIVENTLKSEMDLD